MIKCIAEGTITEGEKIISIFQDSGNGRVL